MSNPEMRTMIDKIEAIRRDLFYELIDARLNGGDNPELTAAFNHIAEAQHAIKRFLQSDK